ncbi:hypothetical protein C5167_006430 [Papaver somniferum]|uniref:Peptidase A1 domain-containing protein n=1 Tax=Papaver somniferum TaxID=3469 RepID=A0A4Y7JHA1_PAPSO|nr:aspartyl protease family protein 2 [Papaver somniferum]RZC59129.1 hypothetical protein C5167_006430 [Papaver somniferum]
MKTAFFFILITAFLFRSGFSKQPNFQTLVVNPLSSSKLQTSNLDDFSWSESQTLTTTESTTELSSSAAEPKSILTLNLQHIDSLTSEEDETHESLFKSRLQRDEARVSTLKSMAGKARSSHGKNATAGRGNGKDFSASIISGLAQGSGEYFTRLGVGTPPRYAYMVLDTGSDIPWIQCQPCRKCYSQTDPIFNPSKSKSYAGVTCNSPLCRKLDASGCNQKKSCLYQVSYGDGSFTFGELATETFTFRGTKIPKIALGCGHDNEGLFVGAAGILGLGRGRLSFPTQSDRRFGGKFSYCLVDRTSSTSSKPSSVVFGESSVSKSAVFTRMLQNPKLDTFYYVGLLGISVGGVRVSGIRSSFFKLDKAGNGGVIIDSGTSVTRLTRPAYTALRDAFRVGTKGLKSAPGFSLFDTCYDLSGQKEVKVPTVVMHFGGGADVSLPAANYLIPVDTNGVFCFAFAGTTGGLSIIGNIQQQGIRVVFDRAGSRVGFSPRGCA